MYITPSLIPMSLEDVKERVARVAGDEEALFELRDQVADLAADTLIADGFNASADQITAEPSAAELEAMLSHGGGDEFADEFRATFMVIECVLVVQRALEAHWN